MTTDSRPDDYLRLGGQGWTELQKLIRGESLDPAEVKRRKEEIEERRVFHEGLTYRAFGPPGDGRLWLVEYLKPVTIDQPCYVLGSDDRLGWIREGQNSVYRYIRDCIRNQEGQQKGRKHKPIAIPL